MDKKILAVIGVVSVLGLTGCGDSSNSEKATDTAKPAPAVATATATATATEATTVSTSTEGDGASLFQSGCFSCHGPATAAAVNAPAIGDKAAWESRIAKGMDALYDVAINGSKVNPVMMPKGGTGFSDDQLKAVVDYMVADAQ